MFQLGLTRREPALGLALTNKPALVVVSFWFPALVPRYHFENARMAAGGFAFFSSCSIYAYLCRYLLSVSATANVREAIECKHQIHRLTKERNHIVLTSTTGAIHLQSSLRNQAVRFLARCLHSLLEHLVGLGRGPLLGYLGKKAELALDDPWKTLEEVF